MDVKATNIVWDTDGEEVDLPTEVSIDTVVEGIENPEMEVADWLSDKYGWCVTSFSLETAPEFEQGSHKAF